MTNNLNNETSMFDKGIITKNFFFSVPRHKIIAAGAQELLAGNETVLKELTRILAPLNTSKLSAIAGWADTVKRRKSKPTDDTATREFLDDSRNKENDRWHYVDLPLGASRYDRVELKDFTRDDDVVQILKIAIRVLQSRGKEKRFSELNALRLVTHLVGDVHQPIHVGCGYIKDKNEEKPIQIEKDPKLISEGNLKDDTGGNDLLLPIDQTPSLHQYWDGIIFENQNFDGTGFAVESNEALTVINEAELTKLNILGKAFSQQIKSGGSAGSSFTSNFATVNLEDLPAQWATASLQAASKVYEGLHIVDKTMVGGKTKYLVEFGEGGQAAYDERCVPIANHQSNLASQNLAGLLAAIY